MRTVADSRTLDSGWCGRIAPCVGVRGLSLHGQIEQRAGADGCRVCRVAFRRRGDANLLLGWHGWRQTYFGLLLGFLLASVVGVALMVVGRAGRRTQLAFGPYLAVAALVLALWPGIVG